MKELVFILDMSGSMYPLTEDVIGGFNSVINEHKNEEALVTTILFSTKVVMIHDRIPIAELSAMTEEDYRACGCTALIDAIGSTIKHIADIHKYIRPEDVPEETKFFILTDGAENSSHLFTTHEVRHMIKNRQENYKWEFIFLAENIDAAETAHFIGIDRKNAYDVGRESEGIVNAFDKINKYI